MDLIRALSEILAIAGALLIFFAGCTAFIKFILRELRRTSEHSYRRIRDKFTHRMILGLDFLIAADIILSILRPNLEEVIVLAVVVAIRTVLTLSLIKEAKELDSIEEARGGEASPPVPPL